MPSVIDLGYTAFITRKDEARRGAFFAGGTGAGRAISGDSLIDGSGSGYSLGTSYIPDAEPLAVRGRFAGFNQRGHAFHPFSWPVLNGRPINAQYPLVDGQDLGRIRRLRGLREGKLGIPNGASVHRGREIPVAMDRVVWARRPPTSLTSRVIR